MNKDGGAKLWSACCLSSMRVVGGNEGTNHYVCNACDKPCNWTDKQANPASIEAGKPLFVAIIGGKDVTVERIRDALWTEFGDLSLIVNEYAAPKIEADKEQPSDINELVKYLYGRALYHSKLPPTDGDRIDFATEARERLLAWRDKQIVAAKQEMLGLIETDRYDLLSTAQIKTLIQYHESAAAQLKHYQDGAKDEPQ